MLPLLLPENDTEHVRESLALLELESAEFRGLTRARLSVVYLFLQQQDKQDQQSGENSTAIAALRKEAAMLRQDSQSPAGLCKRRDATQGNVLLHGATGAERTATAAHMHTLYCTFKHYTEKMSD